MIFIALILGHPEMDPPGKAAFKTLRGFEPAAILLFMTEMVWNTVG